MRGADRPVHVHDGAHRDLRDDLVQAARVVHIA